MKSMQHSLYQDVSKLLLSLSLSGYMQFHSVPCLVILPARFPLHKCAELLITSTILLQLMVYSVSPRNFLKYSKVISEGCPNSSLKCYGKHRCPKKQMLGLCKKAWTNSVAPGTSSSFRPFFRRSKRSDSISAIRCCSS